MQDNLTSFSEKRQGTIIKAEMLLGLIRYNRTVFSENQLFLTKTTLIPLIALICWNNSSARVP